MTAGARNTAGYLWLREAVAAANPTGGLYLISDNLSSHRSPPIQERPPPPIRHLRRRFPYYL